MVRKIFKLTSLFVVIGSPVVIVSSTTKGSTSLSATKTTFFQTFQTRLKTNFKSSRWITQTRDDTRNKINNGDSGTIFEDSRNNLWAMGDGTPLQKLVPSTIINKNEQQPKATNIIVRTRVNKDNRLVVWIVGYREYRSPLFTHLQYRKEGEIKWKIVRNKIMLLANGNYEFKWVLGTNEELASDTSLPQSFDIFKDGKVAIATFTEQMVEQVINNANLNKDELPTATNVIPNGITSSKVVYTFDVWIQDDDEGKITWLATLSRGAKSKQISGIISGFKNKVTSDINFIKKLEISLINTIFRNASFNKLLLPSKVEKPKNGIFTNVTYSFNQWDPDDKNGKIAWEITIKKGSITRKRMGILNNFKKSKRTILEAERIYKKLKLKFIVLAGWNSFIKPSIKKSITKLFGPFNKNLLPSQIHQPNNGLVSDFKYHYRIRNWDYNDNNGIIKWSVILRKGSKKNFYLVQSKVLKKLVIEMPLLIIT